MGTHLNRFLYGYDPRILTVLAMFQASKYLENDDLGEIIDPSLKTFKEEELEVICDVMRECLKPDQRHRPSMKDVAEQLKQVIDITPEKATPRSSPLWWAELEILSAEAT